MPTDRTGCVVVNGDGIFTDKAECECMSLTCGDEDYDQSKRKGMSVCEKI